MHTHCEEIKRTAGHTRAHTHTKIDTHMYGNNMGHSV